MRRPDSPARTSANFPVTVRPEATVQICRRPSAATGVPVCESIPCEYPLAEAGLRLEKTGCRRAPFPMNRLPAFPGRCSPGSRDASSSRIKRVGERTSLSGRSRGRALPADRPGDPLRRVRHVELQEEPPAMARYVSSGLFRLTVSVKGDVVGAPAGHPVSRFASATVTVSVPDAKP